MLLTVLNVLKIIGIVLLVILAALLLLILLVLFVPVRYRIDARVPDTDLDEGFDPEKIWGRASFSWLLFVLRGKYEWPADKAFVLRVFGIKLKSKKDGNEADKEQAEDVGKESVESSSVEKTPEENDSASDDKIDDGEFENNNTCFDSDIDDSADEEKTFLDVLWDIIDKIENILKTPQNVFEKIQYTISRVCDKITMIKTTLENDIFKRAFSLVKRKLIKVLKMILPDKCDIDVTLGTGDPATTAEMMGIVGMLYPILYKKVRLTPDFERKAVSGTAHIKGHITVFTVIWSVAVCYFNKDVKKVIKRFKKILDK
ncbi:MAG: DUF2953 domain-containing protein [Butyrivibrio sp.]|nr:DUF2953 domain-containing protein [Butyrivibrio sp.]